MCTLANKHSRGKKSIDVERCLDAFDQGMMQQSAQYQSIIWLPPTGTL
jgi:hypothetical protein